MKKEDLIKKLTSRKFWAAVAAFVASLIVAFSGDSKTAETVTGIIMAGATVIAYILGEGLIDAKTAGCDEPSIMEINEYKNAAMIAAILAADKEGKEFEDYIMQEDEKQPPDETEEGK